MSRTHDAAVWSQIALYTGTGALKLIKAPQELTDDLGFRWASTFPEWAVKAIACAELAAAAALTVSRFSRLRTRLVRAAVRGLGLLQVGAIAVNVRHGEVARLPVNVAAIALAVTAGLTAPGPRER